MPKLLSVNTFGFWKHFYCILLHVIACDRNIANIHTVQLGSRLNLVIFLTLSSWGLSLYFRIRTYKVGLRTERIKTFIMTVYP